MGSWSVRAKRPVSHLAAAASTLTYSAARVAFPAPASHPAGIQQVWVLAGL